MTAVVTKSSLPEPHRQLLELMQHVNFGRIERLVIDEGQPLLEPRPRVVREFRFPGENGSRPEAAIEDFSLKAQVVELFRSFDEMRDGLIDVLEIKHGLPFRMIVEDSA